MTTHYEYDILGHTSRIFSPEGMEVRYRYDCLDRLEQIHYGNGIRTSYQYDADGNVSHLETRMGSDILLSFRYQYDGNGNRLSKTGVQGPATDGSCALDITYQYDVDVRGQLLEENRKDAVFRYNYDAAGNRIRKEETGENRNIETVYSYNEKNQLINTEEIRTDGIRRRNTFTYSRQGSILKEETESGTCRYFYNSKNQQIRIERADGQIQENRYDAEGLRHEMRENGKLLGFVYQNGELLYEEGGDKETASCHLGAGIEAVRRGQRTYYYHPDEQLSTALITDETGTIKNQYRYDAFGAGLEVSEELPNRIRYTGQQYDEITEQYYLRARHYNPILGRFLQEDVCQGDGLNLYAYCRNNPVVYWDPSGYEVTSNPRFNTQQDLELRIKNTPSLKNSYGEWADPNMRGNTDFKVNMSNTDVEYAGLIAAMNAHNTDKVNYSNGMIDLEDFAVFSVDVEISRWRSTTHRRTNKEIARQILEYGGDYDAMFKNNVMGIGSGTLESQRIAKEVINSDAVQNALKVSGSDPRKIREIAKVLNDEKKVYDQVIHETNLELDKTENTTQWVSKEINDKLGHLAGTAEQKQIDNEKNKNKPCNNS